MFARIASLACFVLLWAGALQDVSAASVRQFSPQGLVKGVRQVRAEFSSPMVPFGDPGVPVEPFVVQCPVPGQGRWLDQLNWVYDFERDLVSGLECGFRLRPGLTDLDGTAMTGRGAFQFSTGGPAITRSIPWEGSRGLVEDAVFVLFLDGPVSDQSVLDNAYFVVDGLASDVAVRIIEGEEREAVIASQWIGDTPRDQLILVQPRQTLPADARVRLTWGRGVASPTGVATIQDQVLEFQTRPLFSAEFRCSRENADRHCIPLSSMHLSLSAPVPADRLQGVRLTGPNGFVRVPKLDEDGLVYSLSFAPPFPPETEFRLELPGGVTDEAGRRLANADRFPLRVRTDRYPPLAKFAASFGIIEAGEGAALPVTVRHLEDPFEVGRLQPAGPAALTGSVLRAPDQDPRQIFEWLQKLSYQPWDNREKSVFEGTDARPELMSVPRPNGETAFEVLGIPLEKPGFYVVEIQSRVLGEALLAKPQPMYVASSALVTNLAVHLKWGLENALIWVTELASARPVSEARVQAWDCAGNLLWEGVTGRDGTVTTDHLPALRNAPRCSWQTYGSGLMITARRGDDLSFVHSNWQDGIEGWRFRLPGLWDEDRVQAHTVLDRSLLRAGDKLQMKHILRQRSVRGFSAVPADDRPQILLVRHAAAGDEYRMEVSWDEAGIAESSWEVPRQAKLGMYELILRREPPEEEGQDEFANSRFREWTTGSFRVEEFRVPLMRASLQGPSTPQVMTRQLPLSATVEYLSGGPAKGLPVLVRYQFRPGLRTGFPDWEDFTFGGGEVREGTVRSGEDSQPEPPEMQRISSVLDESGGVMITVDTPGEHSRPLELAAELEFRDPNGSVQTVASRVPLWPSGRLAGIRLDGWMMPQDKVVFDVVVTDLEGRGLAGVQVDVDLFERAVISHRKRLVGGFYAYEHYRQVSRHGVICSGLSDDKGILRCEGPFPVAGNVVLEARVADEMGRGFRTSREFWVAGEAEAWFEAEDHDRIDLLPERPSYEPGETARFQVRMPFRNATALITVEREGVARHFVTAVDAKDSSIRVPLEASDAPNVFVSALLVRGRIGGTPPTAFVDLARPSYKLGIAEVQVGWARSRLDVTVRPEREVYRVRERARIDLQVSSKRGPLPARSEVAVAVVDEGLLELWPNRSWDLLEAMMGRRGYGMETSTAQMHVVGKRHFGLKALPQGGGGGTQSTRELFDTLLLWQGRVRLDGQGRARVDIPLNDSVTSFRVVAVATAGLDQFGTGAATIRSTQDLTLFSGIPPTAREGDSFQAEFTVRNSSTREINANVTMRILELGTTEVRTVRLAPGDGAVIGFPVRVPKGHALLRYELDATAGDFTDRLRIRQEIAPAVPVRILQATFAQLSEPYRLEVQLPEAADPDRGGVQVELRRSLLGGLNGARDYMAGYPYTCLEQVLSRAVTLDDRDLWDRWMAALAPYLDADGLLRYFPDQRQGSDVLTAYVLSLAGEAGWPVPEPELSQMLDGMSGFVTGQVNRHSWLATADLTLRRVAALEALSRYGRAEPGMLSSLTVAPELWPTSTVVDWYNLLRRMEEPPWQAGTPARTEQVLRARLSFQGTTAGFSTEAGDRLSWLMVSPDVNLARLILAFLEAGVGGDDLPRLVQGFVARQRHGRWDLTTANAWAALAVRKFAESYESTPVSGDSTMRLGDSELTLNWVEAPDGGRLDLAWPPGTDPLDVVHTGEGAPWIWVRSSAALEGVAVESGYRVRRQVTPVEQRRPGQWSVGDLARVRLEIDAQSDNTWVVLDDPIPSGAVILGTGLRDSALSTEEEQTPGWRGPIVEERTFRSFRAWWDVMRKGQHVVEYTVRVNTPGTFPLPPTRVEAMYSPEIFGELPNPPVEVVP